MMAAWERGVKAVVSGSIVAGIRQRLRARFVIATSLWALVAMQVARVQSTAAAALVLARDPARTIDLSTFSGKTYLQAVLEAGDGINAKTAVDDATAITISSTIQILAELGTFDPDTAQKCYSHFNNGQADFQTTVSRVTGLNLSPQQIQNAVAPFLFNFRGDRQGAKVSASDLILLTSGSGTVVRLTGDDYFYNVAYESPTTSSGRSYAVTATRRLLDATDNYYLTELGNYLTSASDQEVANFYRALFNVLTACDASGLAGLSSSGQTVLTDFLAVYTAELMRHNMVNLEVNTKPWDADIGEVTLLSAYITVSGQVMDQGKLVSGGPKTYALGGSIGTHMADFTKLAKLITSYENQRSHHKAMIKAVMTATPMKKGAIATAVSGDVFRRALIFLDQPQFESDVHAKAAGIGTAMVQLLSTLRTDQAQITAYVLKHQ